MANQQGLVAIEVTKNERKYTYLIPMGAPYGETYDAAFEIMQEVLKLADDATKRAQRKEGETVTPELVNA